jgi:hypothetical protein
MNRQRTLVVAGLYTASLAIMGGCANPHGTAIALSAVIPVSSPAAASSSTASSSTTSSAVSSSAVSSPAVSSSSAVSSPAGASTTVHDSTQIYGAVTADSERQLVLTYLGGDCDSSAHGVARESGSVITVRVVVKTSNGLCDAVGYIRTAVAQLSAPWGNRAVRDTTGATVPVVDGALLLSPSWLPDGYQGGGLRAGASADGQANVLQEWTPPDMTQTASPGVITCRPTTAGIVLTQGYGIGPTSPLLTGEYALDDGTAVDVDRDDQGDFALYWPPPGHPKGWTVSLGSEQECTGFTPLSLDTLLKIASGLH